MTPRYHVRQQDLCENIEEEVLKERCEEEVRMTIQRMNHVLRQTVNATENEGARGTVKVLLYDRSEGKVNGRRWINAEDSLVKLRERFGDAAVTHLRNIEVLQELFRKFIYIPISPPLSPHDENHETVHR